MVRYVRRLVVAVQQTAGHYALLWLLPRVERLCMRDPQTASAVLHVVLEQHGALALKTAAAKARALCGATIPPDGEVFLRRLEEFASRHTVYAN